MAKKKSIINQVMKTKDWVMLTVLILVAAGCWMWVLNAYGESLDYQGFVAGAQSIR